LWCGQSGQGIGIQGVTTGGGLSMYLNCHSYHSLRYGTLSLETLVQQALACGATSLALTDINTVTGIYDFVKICHKEGIKPVVGMEFREGNRLLYIGLAKTQRGIGELCRLLPARNCEGTPLPDQATAFGDAITIYPLSNVPQQLGEDDYIGIRPDELNLLVQEKWKRLLPRMVVLNPVAVSGKREHNLHRILRAIDLNVVLSRLSEDDFCRADEYMRPRSEEHT